VSVHTVSLRISTCKSIPRVYFTKMISMVQFAAWLHLVQWIWTLIASLLGNELTLETILQVQRDFLTCHALRGKCNKCCSTRHAHYIPHSPVSLHSSVRLHSSVSSHSSHSCRQLHMFTQPLWFTHCPCSMYLLQQWFPTTALHQLFLDSVKSHVFFSDRGSYAHFHSAS